MFLVLASPLGACRQDQRLNLSVSSADRCLIALEQANEQGYDFGDFGGIQSVYLSRGESAQEDFDLKKGTSYRFVAVGGSRHADIEMSILGPGGNVIARESRVRPVAQIDFTPGADAAYRIRVGSVAVKEEGTSDVSLLSIERVTYSIKTTREAAAWLQSEGQRISQAQRAARLPLPVSPYAPAAAAGQPVPWFMYIARLRGIERRPANSTRWDPQTYSANARVALGGETNATLRANVVDPNTGASSVASRGDGAFDIALSVPGFAPAKVGFGLSNQSARPAYVVAYVIRETAP